jgi:hypothetical protein
MRPLLCAVSASLLATTTLAPLALAEPCARGPEKAAFDVAGLKSELMVIAIACQLQDKYNDFIIRFRRDLVAGERAVDNYFARTGHGHAREMHDNYITNLANSQSQDGLKQGTLFCDQHHAMFDEVMQLKDGKELPTYAVSKALAQPIDLSECPAQEPKKKLRTASSQKQ